MDDTRLLRAVDAARRSLNDQALLEAHLKAEREFALLFGLRRGNMRRRCLAVLAGERCEQDHPGNERCGACGFSLLDHTTVFRRDGENKATVLVSQPYRCANNAWSVARRYGLSLLATDDWSWWNPGSTTLYVFDARGEIGERQ